MSKKKIPKGFKGPGGPLAEGPLMADDVTAATPTKALPTKVLTNPGARYDTGPLTPGRQTQAVNVNPFGLNGWAFLPKRQYQSLDVSSLNIRNVTFDQLVPLLADVSPDFSKALWDFIRIMGVDVEFTAVTPTGADYPAAQKELDDLIDGLNNQFGGIDQIIRQLGMSAYLQGACSLEAAPTLDLKDLDDLYPVNPDSIYFQRDATQKLVAFQRQLTMGLPSVPGGQTLTTGAMPFAMLNPTTFFYVPVDPFVDDPYGRSPVAPAVNAVLALARVLTDLQTVVHHQGWPRIDIKVIWQMLEESIPEGIKDDENAVGQFVRARMDEIVEGYQRMTPDDAFVHLDYVEISGDKVAAGTKLFDVGGVVGILRSQLIIALKSLPIFHGETSGTTETYGTVEYEIYVSSVQVLRELVGDVLARGLEVGLQLRGILAVVQQDWGPIRTTDRLADASAEAREIENEVTKRDEGWIDQDEASKTITGSDAVGPEPEPQAVPSGPAAMPPMTLPGSTPPAAKGALPKPAEPPVAKGALPDRAFAGAGMYAAMTKSALARNGRR